MKVFRIRLVISIIIHAVLFYILMSFNFREFKLDISIDKLYWHFIISLSYGVAMAYVFRLNIKKKDKLISEA